MYHSRIKYNIKILKNILSVILNNPELRFFQILILLKIIEYDSVSGKIKDKFYEESEETYNKLLS